MTYWVDPKEKMPSEGQKVFIQTKSEGILRLKYENELFGPDREGRFFGMDQVVVWSYQLPQFFMANYNDKKSFKIPESPPLDT